MLEPPGRGPDAPRHRSQFGQDALVGDILFQGRTGVFVDVGARDGVVISNTLYLEQLGWTGIAIEPHPGLFAELQASRSCRCLNVAAGRQADTLDFVKMLEEPLGNSGLVETFYRDQLPDRHELTKRHEIIPVPVLPLSEILEGTPVVHYLDIDVEGHELAVLQGIDFSRTEFRIIGVESGRDRFVIDDFLAAQGYRPFLNLRSDRFYSFGRLPNVRWLLEMP